ncbi:MAG: hypothetical protein EHM53_09815 [Methanoregulaceae archaeon]|nr:MAG: hypothetical protein EHM53_09815 [Methanoregulaceae archaeon]
MGTAPVVRASPVAIVPYYLYTTVQIFSVPVIKETSACNKENDLLAFIDPAHRFHDKMDWLKAHEKEEVTRPAGVVLYRAESPVR